MASVRSSGASQSTIKLVATNLIANGKLSGMSQEPHSQTASVKNEPKNQFRFFINN